MARRDRFADTDEIVPVADISLAAAASLAGVTRPEARRTLTELAAAGLLIEHSAGRYVLHDLLRAYSTEQAADPDAGERPVAVARLVDHYLQTAHAGTLLLAPLGHPITLDPPLAGEVSSAVRPSANGLSIEKRSLCPIPTARTLITSPPSKPRLPDGPESQMVACAQGTTISAVP